MEQDLPVEESLGRKLPVLIREVSCSELELLLGVIKTPEVRLCAVENLKEILSTFNKRRLELEWGSKGLDVVTYLLDSIKLGEDFLRGFEDGVNKRECRPDSMHYVRGFEHGQKVSKIGEGGGHPGGAAFISGD